MFWIVIAWLLVGWLTWRWHYIWGTNQFGADAFEGAYWWLFHLFIGTGAIYLVVWLLFVVWWRISQGISFLGKE